MIRTERARERGELHKSECARKCLFNMWNICVVMVKGGGRTQVEPTQQYCSTFIVLPARWNLALRQQDVDNTAQTLWSDVCLSLEKVFLKTREHTDMIHSGSQGHSKCGWFSILTHLQYVCPPHISRTRRFYSFLSISGIYCLDPKLICYYGYNCWLGLTIFRTSFASSLLLVG